MSSSTIAPIVEADYEVWSRLWQKYLEFYETVLPDSQYKNTFSRLISPTGDLHGFLIRDESGKAVGLAHYLYHSSAWTEKAYCYLNDLYVDPECRGGGYGKKLILAVKEASAKEGAQRLYWATAPDNLTARRLYDKLAVTNRVQYRVDL
jgi:GNAT superfamily N-acetyltransferase